VSLLTKEEEDHLFRASVLGERIFHEAHKIAAHNGAAEPAEIAAITIAIALAWARLSAHAHEVA
jgi:hypothetical protein